MEITKEHISDWLKQLQIKICDALETADGGRKFTNEHWSREEGGGGITKIINNGDVIEKGGVLYSAVYGDAPDFLFEEKEHSALGQKSERPKFYATGVSIVIHPISPMVPIIHMNIRYFEMDNGTKWLGGGIDLTPHYIVEEDAIYFHSKLKKLCDTHHTSYYNKFKRWADDYFYIPHRKETRGIGGIFFDRLNSDSEMSFEQNFDFWKNVGENFAPIYSELIKRNKDKSYTDGNKQWQLLRRGRYVEFNLVYDKGTQFGLQTNGRVESILMSLPKFASWEYDFKPEEHSEEQKTLSYLKKEIDWVTRS
jgi:coproporphyrinogen III oxidase